MVTRFQSIGKAFLCVGIALGMLLSPACGGGGGGSAAPASPATAAPMITTQPIDQTVSVGSSVTFSSTVTGNPTPTLQWEFTSDGIAWSPFANATVATLTFTPTAASNGIRVRLKATNSLGVVTSNGASLILAGTGGEDAWEPNNSFLTSTTLASGAQITPRIGNLVDMDYFTVNLATAGTLSINMIPPVDKDYDVELYDSSFVLLAAPLLATGQTETIAYSAAAGRYYIRVVGFAGDYSATSTYSLAASWTGTGGATAPAFTQQPQSLNVSAGANAIFTVAASGNPTPTYQWERSANGTTWTAITGATSATYTLVSAQTTDNGAQFRAKAINSVATVPSNAAVLTITTGSTAPAFTLQPQSLAVSVGANATFTVAASGNPTPTYQWERSANGTTWTAITGATSATYTLVSAQTTDSGAQFRAKAINSVATVPSNAAVLTITTGTTAPAFTLQPQSLAVSVGANATFTVAASGNPTPTYQWERSANGTTWSAITGATSATYTLVSAQTTDNGAQFRANAINSVATVPSNAAVLTVNGTTSVASQHRIAAGDNHSLWVRPNGTVWAWGRNNYGQLGNGTTVDRVAPFQVSLIGAYVAVASGPSHCLALKDDGTVWSWGYNSSGQLGNATATNSPTPVAVIGLPEKIKAIAAGGSHSLALTVSGTVWAWGSNIAGELGDGTHTGHFLPVQVLAPTGGGALTGITDLVARGSRSFALKADGTVWEWGLGNLVTGLPAQVTALSGIQALAIGDNHFLALSTAGVLSSWGSNTSGQLGNNSPTPTVPSPVLGTGSYLTMAVTFASSLGVKADGTLWAWGSNSDGQLGDGTTVTHTVPVPLADLGQKVTAVAGGKSHCLALLEDGSLMAWGYNFSGQLGEGTTLVNRLAPVRVAGVEGQVTTIAAAGAMAAALSSDGQVWSWGSNTNGQIGDGTTADHYAPAAATAVKPIKAVAVGGGHSLAVSVDGSMLFAWGRNTEGQLGDGSATNHPIPISIAVTGSKVVGVAAGSSHSLAVKEDGTVWAWGTNTWGQLGLGNSINSSTPTQITLLVGKFLAVAARGDHSFALRDDGTVWAWGYNSSGELGINSNTNSNIPVQVVGLNNITKIAIGRNHTLALKIDGSVYAWGNNSYNQLGDGSSGRLIPGLPLTNMGGVTDIAAGADFTLAVKQDGSLWGWGFNMYKNLAPTGLVVAVPTQVMALTGVKAVAANDSGSYALKTDGTLWSMGFTTSGQMGDGLSPLSSGSFANPPVQVSTRP